MPLPIYDLEQDLHNALTGKDIRLVIEAPTGSGKSTQVPKMVADHPEISGQVLVLQPRRIAARMLAKRVAEERGSRLGEEVGYQVRFENVAGANTRIKYITEGLLMRQMLSNPLLKGIDAVIFDEFHERHLHGDIGIAQCLALQETRRADLRLVVMSATLDSDRLEDYLAPAVRLRSEGRTFPVDIEFHPPKQRRDSEIWSQVSEVLTEAIGRRQLEGDALVFLPGAYEIRRTVEHLRRQPWAKGYDVMPLYGELPPKQQDAAVASSTGKKIVVSTNVAETSLTIAGVRIVVDSGLARIPNFDPNRNIQTLTIEKISRASADQRAGRAGRTAPGVCLRLWSEKDHHRRDAQEDPEIRRIDLTEAVLMMKSSGIVDVSAFRWLDAPEPKALEKAEQLLVDLGAISEKDGPITPVGKQMIPYPVHPRYARLLIAALEQQCVPEAALFAALNQGRRLFLSQRGGTSADEYAEPDDLSDFFPMARAWNAAQQVRFDPQRCSSLGVNANAAREVAGIYKHLLRIAKAPAESARASQEALGKAILAGFSDQVAYSPPSSKTCKMVHGRRGQLSKDSTLKSPELFVAAEITEIEGKDLNVILSHATLIEREWLETLFPDDFQEGVSAAWDETNRRVIQQREIRFRDLVLESRESGEPNEEAAAGILAKKVVAGDLVLKSWDAKVESWIARLNALSEWMPELELPPINEEDKTYLIQEICLGARTYRQLKDKPVWPVLKKWLSPAQQGALDEFAPERVRLSNGKTPRVFYAPGEEPTIKVVLQQLYDVDANPAIAQGKVPLLIQILAPNQRPIQVTKDLKGFWENSYASVKSQLKGRYPKHEWR